MEKIIIIAVLLLLTVVLFSLVYCYYQFQDTPVPISSLPCGYVIDENDEIHKCIPTADKIKEVQACQ